MQPAKKTSKSVFFLVLGFVLLLIIAYVMSSSFSHNGGGSSSKTANTKENVQVQKVDLSSSQGNAKIPAGFPSNIPVETAGVFESYSATYPDHHLTQYTVNYTSASSLKDAFNTYNTFLSQNGYTTTNTIDEKTEKTLVANKGNDTLTIIVSNAGGKTDKTSVYLTYISRQ